MFLIQMWFSADLFPLLAFLYAVHLPAPYLLALTGCVQVASPRTLGQEGHGRKALLSSARWSLWLSLWLTTRTLSGGLFSAPASLC